MTPWWTGPIHEYISHVALMILLVGGALMWFWKALHD